MIVAIVVVAIVSAAVVVVARPDAASDPLTAAPTATVSDASQPTAAEAAMANAPRCVVVEIERRCSDAALVLPDMTVPLIDGGRIFVSDPVTAVAYDAGTFAPLWSVPSEGREFVVGVIDDLALLASRSGDTAALDTADGQVRWTRPSTNTSEPLGRRAFRVVLPPADGNDTALLLEQSRGRVAALDLEGNPRWDVSFADSEVSGVLGQSVEFLFVRDGETILSIDRADGSVRGTLPIPSENSVLTTEGVVLAIGQDPESYLPVDVTSFDAVTGDELWNAAGGIGSAYLANGLVGIEDAGVLSMRDVTTGEVVWSAETEAAGLLSPETPGGQHLVATRDDGTRRLDIRDQRDGRRLWSVLPDSIDAYLSTSGPWVTVVSADEFAFHDRATGELVFRMVGLDGNYMSTAFDTDPMLVFTRGALFRVTPPDSAGTALPDLDPACRVGATTVACVRATVPLGRVDGGQTVQLSEDTIVVGVGDEVRALAASDGRLLWAHREDIRRGVRDVSDTHVFISPVINAKAQQLALDIRTGDVVAAFEPTDLVVPLSGGHVAVRSTDDGVDVLRLDTGARRWRIDSSDLALATLAGQDRRFLSVDDRLVVIAERVTAFDVASGEQTGQVLLDRADRFLDVVGDIVYVARSGAAPSLAALSLSTGSALWSVFTGLPARSTPTDRGMLIFTDTLALLDPTNGTRLYEFPADNYVVTGDVGSHVPDLRLGGRSPTGPAALVTYQYGQLSPTIAEVRDLDTGEVQWTYETASVQEQLVTSLDWFVRVNEQGVTVHDRETGDVLLTYVTSARPQLVSAQPLVIQMDDELRFLDVPSG